MGRPDLQRAEQADHVIGHVPQLVGCGDGNAQGAQLEQFQCAEPLAALHSRRFADVAVVEPNHAKAARGELAAEFVVPMDHLGAQSHDENQRFGIG